MDSVGERLEYAIEKSGLDRASLATRLDVHYETVGRWIRDNALPKKMTILEAMTEALGVTLEWLRDGVGEMRLPAGREVPKEIGGVPVIDALKGGQQLYRMPLMFGDIPLAYVTITITVEPGPGAGGVQVGEFKKD